MGVMLYILESKLFSLFFDFYVKVKLFFRSFISFAEGRVMLKRVKNKGENCRFNGLVTINSINNLYLGNGVRVGKGSFFHAIGGISIGDNTQISRNVVIYSGNHNIEGCTIPYDNTYITKNVVIGHSVWIGMNVCITPGVKIGNGAVIGMNTTVSKDVPDGAIVVGSKQRVVGYRDMNDFESKNKNGMHFSKEWPNH